MDASATVVVSGDTLALGSHTTTATATDSAGNSSTESFSFSVVDTTNPVITIESSPAEPVEATGATGAVVDFSAIASDIVDGSDDVVFTDALPIGATGKILKNKIRDIYRDYKLPTA